MGLILKLILLVSQIFTVLNAKNLLMVKGLNMYKKLTLKIKKDIVKCHEVHGLSYADLAERFNSNRSTISKVLTAARKAKKIKRNVATKVIHDEVCYSIPCPYCEKEFEVAPGKLEYICPYCRKAVLQ